MESTIELTQHPLIEGVESVVGEPVLQAIFFQRVDADSARHIISKGHGAGGGGLLPGMIFRLIGKKKAGGLPNSGILAVTEDKVRAFKMKGFGPSFKPKEEVAVRDRANLTASIEVKGKLTKTTRLTLESPTEDEKVVVEVMRKYEQMAEELVRLIQAEGVRDAAR